MNRTQAGINVIHHHTTTLSPNFPQNLQQHASALLAELPLPLRTEAQKFIDFTDTVLGRLHGIGKPLCKRYLLELRYCPENYDQLSGYHVDLLARRIAEELDALYRCLGANTMDVISISYTKWIRDNSKEEYQEIESTC